MSDPGTDHAPLDIDSVPATADALRRQVLGYLIGLVLAALLTAASFVVLDTQLVWGPAIRSALVVLAVAQMGVHLVFFLHITTAPDNVNNIVALVFGALIVALVVAGSVWIMWHLNAALMPMPRSMPEMTPQSMPMPR